VSQEKQLAEQLFGPAQDQKSKGTLEAIKEAFQAVAPGLSLDKIVGDVGHEMKQQAAFGAHELAAALFNESAFVMYPRGARDDGKDGHGVHGPEQGQGEQSFIEKLQQEGQQQERGGREM
jgi:hypothetical protein